MDPNVGFPVVYFAEGITMVELTSPLETAARKNIDATLNNLGWNTDEASPACNVFTERAKTRQQSELLNGRPPDYTLYRSGSDEAIGIIEAKKPGDTLARALIQAAEYAELLGVPIIFASDGTITEARDLRTGSPLRIDGDLVTYVVSEQILLRFISEGPNIVSAPEFTLSKQQLIQAFADANDTLRNEGLREGIERFTEFANLLFLKLISEIEDEREKTGEERILERHYCWEGFCNLNGQQMLEYINGVILPRLVNRYNHSGDVFQQNLLIRTPATLKRIVDNLSKLTLLNADSDIKGDAFEYFLKHSITVGNDLGEHFTPRHIVRLMVELIDPRFGETVYDPCCGTGGFLIYAFEHIKRKILPNSDSLETLRNDTVYGRELTGNAKVAKMNMILTGDGHTNIVQTDSLSDPVRGQYDVVLTNYPFTQKTEYAGHYGLRNRDANPVFLKHVIDALKPGGRAAVVVPDSILFDDKSQYLAVRQVLLRECNVKAVIKLHRYVFKPYAGQPTSVIIFHKGQPTNRVWFFEVNEDGYKKTGSKYGRPPIADNDLIKLREVWDRLENTDQSFTIGIDDIVESGYKLAPNLLRSKTKNSGNWVPLAGDVGLCEIVIGKTPSTREPRYWEGRHPWVTIADFTSKYIANTGRTITDAGVNETNSKLIPENTVLFSFKLSVGKTALTRFPVYTNEAIAALIPKDDRVLAEYLYYVLPELDYTPYVHEATKGVTLNKSTMATIMVPVPPVVEQETMIQSMRDRDAQRDEHLRLADEVRFASSQFVQEHIRQT